MTKNTTPREGWLNKHNDGMPKERCNMAIQLTHNNDEVVVGVWEPSEKEGNFGTLYAVAYTYTGRGGYFVTGYHCWADNNSEFTYYKTTI